MNQFEKQQCSLGGFIFFLSRIPIDRKVRFDFAHFQPTSLGSYRGFYDELGLGFEKSHFGVEDHDWTAIIETRFQKS